MSDPVKTVTALAKAQTKARVADAAAKAIARDCDVRIKKARKALSLIDTYAWSMVGLPKTAARELQRRIDFCRATLRELDGA